MTTTCKLGTHVTHTPLMYAHTNFGVLHLFGSKSDTNTSPIDKQTKNNNRMYETKLIDF